MRISALLGATVLFLALCSSARAAEIVVEKHIVPAPAPVNEPDDCRTPDGTFSVRDPGAPFHSDRLADAMFLDADGRDENGDYLNLNHAVYTAYRLASDQGSPDTVLVLMPGTWAGSMSMDRFARDALRMAEESGRSGLQVWLLDRRSEQLEDHRGLMWAKREKGAMPVDDIIQAMDDYYRPAFEPEGRSAPLMGKSFTPLGHDAVRFIAGWGADVALRDWRAVVLEAHRAVGNEVSGGEVDRATVKKLPGRHVFIGGHSLGGSLTVMYASYDFDRRPGSELLGMDDVDGLVLLEGGDPVARKVEKKSGKSYLRDVHKRYQPGKKVYFDLNVLGIEYAPPTMLSVGIAGWAADNARGRETIFPDYSRPKIARLPRATNEALLGYSFDDDVSPFFIARVSFGYPSGEFGMAGQFRRKLVTVPKDPGDCPVVTPWRPGHRALDPDYLYDWVNIGAGGETDADVPAGCAGDDPEVTDFYDFARSLYAGPDGYIEVPWLSRGPNDFPEWYFPPRLSMDSRLQGTVVFDRDRGIELLNATASGRMELPVISFVGDDSMGEYSAPELTEDNFAPGVLARPETAGHVLKGYTHLDITAATRNNQPELIAGGHEGFNGCSVYAFRFMEEVIARGEAK